jgi:hypothetical protein
LAVDKLWKLVLERVPTPNTWATRGMKRLQDRVMGLGPGLVCTHADVELSRKIEWRLRHGAPEMMEEA